MIWLNEGYGLITTHLSVRPLSASFLENLWALSHISNFLALVFFIILYEEIFINIVFGNSWITHELLKFTYRNFGILKLSNLRLLTIKNYFSHGWPLPTTVILWFFEEIKVKLLKLSQKFSRNSKKPFSLLITYFCTCFLQPFMFIIYNISFLGLCLLYSIPGDLRLFNLCPSYPVCELSRPYTFDYHIGQSQQFPSIILETQFSKTARST